MQPMQITAVPKRNCHFKHVLAFFFLNTNSFQHLQIVEILLPMVIERNIFIVIEKPIIAFGAIYSTIKPKEQHRGLTL